MCQPHEVDFDEFADEYETLLQQKTRLFSNDHTIFARYKAQIASEVAENSPLRVLEFGCGIGLNIPFLQEAFPDAEIMGSDISSRSLEVARVENPGIHFWTEGECAEERTGFDLVFVAGVFHHIRPTDRNAAAELLAKRVNPGGMVLVFEHNPYNPITRKIVSDCPFDKGVELVAPRELRRRLGLAGLNVMRQGYTLFFPPRLTALTRLEPMLKWLPLGGQYWVSAHG